MESQDSKKRAPNIEPLPIEKIPPSVWEQLLAARIRQAARASGVSLAVMVSSVFLVEALLVSGAPKNTVKFWLYTTSGLCGSSLLLAREANDRLDKMLK